MPLHKSLCRAKIHSRSGSEDALGPTKVLWASDPQDRGRRLASDPLARADGPRLLARVGHEDPFARLYYPAQRPFCQEHLRGYPLVAILRHKLEPVPVQQVDARIAIPKGPAELEYDSVADRFDVVR